MKKVLSVQIPAPCPFTCSVCRNPVHERGSSNAVLRAVSVQLGSGDFEELHITSNGETGLSPIFLAVVDLGRQARLRVSVIGASERSVVFGLDRVEISITPETRTAALKAIEKAKRLSVPFTVSVIDDGTDVIDPEAVAKEHGAHGALVRALQAEGRSSKTAGTTRYFREEGANVGTFPVAAYAELHELGAPTICISPAGAIIPFFLQS